MIPLNCVNTEKNRVTCVKAEKQWEHREVGGLQKRPGNIHHNICNGVL